MSKFKTLDASFHLSDIICHSGDCVLVIDAALNILAMTDTFADIYDVSAESLLGKNAHDIYPDFKNSVFYTCIQYTCETKQAHTIIGYSNKAQGHFIVKTVPYGAHYIVHIQPLTRAVAQSGYLNTHDSLTSLPNRNAFDEAMEDLQKKSKHVGLIFLDINRFRSVNETLGFAQGDRLLMELAARLKRYCSHTVYRVGPNQFAIAVLASRADALQVCAEQLAQFETPFRIRDKNYYVTASAGFKYIDNFDISVSEHVSNVESALREAKKLKNGYVEYKGRKELNNVLSVVTEFREALQQGQLEPFYQGQIDTISHQICGAEALVRWRHPERGLVSPLAFLPAVHEYGLNIELDRYMIARVFEDMRSWAQGTYAGLNVSINLSASSICNMETIDFVRKMIADTGIRPVDVTMEITENAVMENVDISRVVIQGLSDMGFKIAIDDFGTGYSSLGYLLKYPTDILKIDKEFIHGVAASSTLQQVAGSMIKLGKSLNMLVVAEGVETKEDAEFLERHECDILQGYYFTKPIAKSEFEVYMQRVGVSNTKSVFR